MRRTVSWLFAPQRRGRVHLLGAIILVDGWVLTSPFRGMVMSPVP